jgi:hypothetical protein
MKNVCTERQRGSRSAASPERPIIPRKRANSERATTILGSTP